MENNNDWKERARKSLVEGALEYIYPAQDIRDLELKAYYSVACLGHIIDAKNQNLLEHLKNYHGSFAQIKQLTIEKVKAFLKKRVKELKWRVTLTYIHEDVWTNQLGNPYLFQIL